MFCLNISMFTNTIYLWEGFRVNKNKLRQPVRLRYWHNSTRIHVVESKNIKEDIFLFRREEEKSSINWFDLRKKNTFFIYLDSLYFCFYFFLDLFFFLHHNMQYDPNKPVGISDTNKQKWDWHRCIQNFLKLLNFCF